MQKIKIPLSEQDLSELMSGEVFEWMFNGQDVYIYNQDAHELLCEEDTCFNLQEEDGELCSLHLN